MFKEQKGITLVALVITIIVLLILAGVSISLVVGQNGVLTQSTSAVKAQKASAAKEAVSLAISALDMEYNAKWASDQSTQRSTVYTVGKLKTALAGAQYDLTAPTETAGTPVSLTTGTQVILEITKGTEQFKIPVTISDKGSVTWGTVQIKDGTGFVDVENI